MAQTFDIRFSSATGLSALLAVPENALRWKGAGQLTIDEHGVSLSATSWLPFPRRRRLRFSPAELSQAWREGDAVRLEIREPQGPVLLPMWAKNAESAAEMMRALPTTRTVELDHASNANRPRYRYDRRLVYSMCAAVALLLVAAFAGLRLEERKPAQLAATDTTAVAFTPDPAVIDASVPEVAATAEVPPESAPADPPREEPAAGMEGMQSAPAMPGVPPADPPARSAEAASREARTAPAPAAESAPAPEDEADAEPFVPFLPTVNPDPGDLVVPIRQNTVAHHTAREILKWFEKVATENTERFAGHLADVDAGRTDQRRFIRELDSLDLRWRNLASGLLASPEARTPELTGFRSTLLAVISYQSSFLTGYASGLRAGDQDAIAKAYAERDRADRALERARLYVR